MTRDCGRRMSLSGAIAVAYGTEAVRFGEIVLGFYEVCVEIAYLHPMPALTPRFLADLYSRSEHRGSISALRPSEIRVDNATMAHRGAPVGRQRMWLI